MPQKKITDLTLISAVTDGLSVPGDDGIQTYRYTPLQMYNYIRGKLPPLSSEISNLALNTSVASSALTIAVKTYAGTDPSSGDPVRVAFRNATVTAGSFLLRTLTSALSMTVSSGSTLGQTSGAASIIWVYLIDNSGTMELAVSHKKFEEDSLVSTTAEGGAGAADSATVMYSTNARTNVPCRIIGYILNTQTTAGTWASAGSKIQLAPFILSDQKPYFRANMGSSQGIPSGVATKMSYDTLDTANSDTTGWYDTTNKRYLPLKAGMYTFRAKVFSVTNNNRAEVRLYLNGVHVSQGDSGGIAGDMGFDVSDTFYMNGSSDYMEVYVYSYSSGTITYLNGSVISFTGNYVGPKF